MGDANVPIEIGSHTITLDDFIPEGSTNINFYKRSLIGFRNEVAYSYSYNNDIEYIIFSPDLSKSITLSSNKNNDFVYLSNDYAILHTYNLTSTPNFGEVRAQVDDDFIVLVLYNQHMVVDPLDWSYVINDGYAYAYGDIIISPNTGLSDTYYYYNISKEFVAMPLFKEIILGQTYHYLVNGNTFNYTTVDVYDYEGNIINTLNHVVRYNNYRLKQFIVEIDGEYYLLGDPNKYIVQ